MRPESSLTLVAMLLVACGGSKEIGYVDADFDGYAGQSDCDDNDPEVHPGVYEWCNGKDDDCDGTVDEDPVNGTTWYVDLDDDGYGISSYSLAACEQPDGYASEPEDCDDLRADSNPAADELCDGVDNDCDDEIDEDDAADALTWYADKDGDGYGDPTDTTVACQPPSGYVEDGTDCDDYRDYYHPAALWYADGDGDGYGDPASEVQACEPPDDHVADGTDCDDTRDDIHPQADEICDAVDNDCDEDLDEGFARCGEYGMANADASFIGESAGDFAGCNVAAAGDVDDDGHDDILVGADHESTVGNDAGAAYLLLGPISGTHSLSSADASFRGEASSDYAGFALSSAGDVDADGHDDLLIGAYLADAGGNSSGAVYLVMGPVSGELGLSAADARLIGEVSGDNAGYSVAGAGDVDGDGHDDMLVGAKNSDAAGSYAGAAYLVDGPTSGDVALSAAFGRYLGESEGDYAGTCVAGAGDVDGDGLADLLVGAPQAGGSTAGAAYLLLGPAEGEIDLSDADAELGGEGANDAAGCAVAGAGDVDRDGYDDVLVGATGEDGAGSDAGAAYLLLGPLGLGDGLQDAQAMLTGEDAGDEAGERLAAGGDLNDDSYDDLLISAVSASSNAGAVYLVLGPVTGEISLSNAQWKLTGDASGDYAGYGASAAGDIDADGYGDLLVGAMKSDTGGTDAGAAYLFLGSDLR